MQYMCQNGKSMLLSKKILHKMLRLSKSEIDKPQAKKSEKKTTTTTITVVTTVSGKGSSHSEKTSV